LDLLSFILRRFDRDKNSEGTTIMINLIKSFSLGPRNLIFFLSLVLTSFSAHSQQKLVLVGGGPARPVQALKQFSEWCEQSGGPLLIVTWASEVPKNAFMDLEKDFHGLFRGQVTNSETAPANLTDQLFFLYQLEQSCGVFFSGGDQVKIMGALNAPGGDAIFAALHKAYDSGKVFGGTSAGTAIMSKSMIADKLQLDGQVPMQRGLGFLPEHIIVDQHFTQRDRMLRLLIARLKTRTQIAIGIDEDTAIIVTNNHQMRVDGNNSVHVYLGEPTEPRETTFKSGDVWNIFKPHAYYPRPLED
jgi:cyanophycinase